MRYTPNYNMVIGEGTDAVNPLTQIFPNFETIDTAMENNKNAGITTASEVTTGGVHAIVRVNTSAPVFRFTATSAWTTGDTMTLDGSAVTVHLTDGTTPKSGAYIIGAEVVGIVNGSLVTLLAGSSFDGVLSFNSRQGVVTPQSGDYTANMIGYNNTTSGLSASEVQSAIDEVAGLVGGGSTISVLWSNPDDTVAFDPSTITLSNSNYDALIISCKDYMAGSNMLASAVVPKGYNAQIQSTGYSGGAALIGYRIFNYVSDTSYSVTAAERNGAVDNKLIVPVKIYGIKF